MNNNITIWHRIIGWAGALSIVIAYLLLTLDVLDPDNVFYNLLNLAGGLLLGYRVYLDRNWANLFLEFFFSAVAVLALYRIFF